MAKQHPNVEEPTRRDFLYVATGAMGAVVVGQAVWPMIDQMNPDASVLALASVEVDVADVEPGQQLTVMWQGKPVFIRRRTDAEIDAARRVSAGEVKDSLARNENIDDSADAADENRSIDEKGEWLVVMGVCTHLGCVPLKDGAEAAKFQGWYCPCHGSYYDSAGRIRKGPAPENLPVPPAQFVNDTTLRVG